MATEGASERRLGIGYFSYQHSMVFVQTLSQPMMTKKWRKNLAAPFCVAERQQPAALAGKLDPTAGNDRSPQQLLGFFPVDSLCLRGALWPGAFLAGLLIVAWAGCRRLGHR
jgi:hypothetical protein